MITIPKLLASCREEFGEPPFSYQLYEAISVKENEWQVRLEYGNERDVDEQWLRFLLYQGLMADVLEISVTIQVPPLLDIDPTLIEERANALNASAARLTRVTTITEGVPHVVWVASIVITESLTLKALREQVQMSIIDMSAAIHSDLNELTEKLPVEEPPKSAARRQAASQKNFH